MRWYEKIIAAHRRVTDAVSHAERLKADRYFVWQEDGRADLVAEGRHAENVYAGSTDLYTKIEFDPWADAIESSFDDSEIAWSKNYADYDPDTKFFHHEWVWEVSDG